MPGAVLGPGPLYPRVAVLSSRIAVAGRGSAGTSLALLHVVPPPAWHGELLVGTDLVFQGYSSDILSTWQTAGFAGVFPVTAGRVWKSTLRILKFLFSDFKIVNRLPFPGGHG